MAFALALALALSPLLGGAAALAKTAPALADVPAGFWDAGRIAVAVRLGYLTPYGDRFEPTWALGEAALAVALEHLPHGPDAAAATAIVARAESAADTPYAAQGTVTHAVFALALVDAMGLGQVASDLAQEPSPWPDATSIPAWDRGASTLLSRLGLNWGNTWADTFQAGGGVQRAQAAWILIGAANLTRSAMARALAPVVAAVHVASAPTALRLGQSVPLAVEVVDAGGHPLPVGVHLAAKGAVGVRDGMVYGRSVGAGEVVASADAGGATAVVRVTVTGAPAPAGASAAKGASGSGGAGAAQGASTSATGGGSAKGTTATNGNGGDTGTTATAGGGTKGNATAGGQARGPFPDVPATSFEASAALASAKDGMLPALAGGDWDPTSPLLEAGLAKAVAVWKDLTPAGGEGLVRSALGAYDANRVVDHADLAETVAAALGLSVVAADEAALRPPYRDIAGLGTRARGSVTVFAHLGLSLGDTPAGRFLPFATTTRAEAAVALVGAAALSAESLGLEASRVVQTITPPTPAAGPVQVGRPVTLRARALDGHGRVVPSALLWHSDDGPVTAAGVFTPRDRGTAVLTAEAPLSRARAVVRVPVARADPPAVALAIVLPRTAAEVGKPLTVGVDVETAAALAATDSGRSVDLSVTGPAGTSNLAATDTHGVAMFTFTPAAAGPYTLSASAQGLASATATVAVESASASASTLAIAAVEPSAPEEGASATFTVDVEGAGGQIVSGDQGRTITLTLTQNQSALPAGTAATPAPVVLTAPDAAGVATFTWTAGLPGTYSATVSASGLTGASEALTVAPAPAAGIVLKAPSTLVVVDKSVAITAEVVDAAGQPTVATVALTVGLGAGSPGTLNSTVTSLDSSGVVGEYTAPATAGASAAIIAESPGLPPAEITLSVVSTLPVDVPSFAAAPYTATAGTSVDVVVDVGSSPTVPDSASNAVPVTLTISPPTGAASTTLTVSDTAGVATFPLDETVAGTYDLSASIAGQAAVTTTLTVEAGAPAELTLTAAPSSLLLPGQTATLTVAVADAYGNPEPASAAVPVSVSVAPSGVGTLTTLQTTAPGAVAEFTAVAAGTATITASSSGLASATVTIVVETSRAALVSGKGMWLMWQDWNTVGSSTIVTTAVEDHITHLYLEVATTNNGFYGADALNSLLPLAHAAHIAVIAWVYTALENPAADAAMTIKVANYVTPSGASVDGVAADIEDVLTPQAVGAYANAVRAALPTMLFVGVTYPPMYHMSYPYAALAKDVDVIAPMDYWHSMPKAYTPTDVYDYVEESIDLIRKLDGQPSLPIAPIGQAYDMFTNSGTGPNNPTPAEIQAAFDAAEADGAIGFSLYRWGTATASEWNLWASLTWGAPASGGASG